MADSVLTTLQLITSGDSIFSGVSEDVLQDWIALAVAELSATAWGVLYTQAVAYLAAHKYASGPGASASSGSLGGSVAERRARNWSIRYNSPPAGAGSDGGMDTTSYGREFLRLRGNLRSPRLAGPVVV